jgi:hypothetical protein
LCRSEDKDLQAFPWRLTGHPHRDFPQDSPHGLRASDSRIVGRDPQVEQRKVVGLEAVGGGYTLSDVLNLIVRIRGNTYANSSRAH